MATIGEISNLDNYIGSAQLGGANEIAINIDTKPIQQLAAYTLMYNRSQYDQRQKDADEKIKQLGALAPYDLVNGIEKDAAELKDAQAKLTEEMAAFAAKGTPKSPKEKIQQQLDFQKKITGQVKLIDAANARKIKLDKYREATQADPKLSAQEKQLRISQVEKLFNDTDINTLPEIPNYDLSTPKNGDAAIESVAVLKNDKDGNAVIDETITQFSIGNTWKNAYLHGNGLAIPTLPANATEQQKAEYEQQKLAYAKTGMGAWQNAAEVYNSALTDPNYKVTETTSDINVMGAPAVTKLTETVDVNKIKQGNPIMGGVLALAERYNAYAEKRLQDIKQGYYIDSVTGEKVLLVGGDKEADIKFIDVTKPLKPEDLAFLDMFARAAPDKVDKKFIQTDNAIQKTQVAETIRNNKADQYLKGREVKLAEDKWKTSQTGGQTQINGAMERAKRIYADMLKLADSQGVISPEKIRQLNTEQLKYLGIEVPQERDADGKIINNGGFKPLDLSEGKEKTKYAIQLVDGNIRVLKDAKSYKTSDGKFGYSGLFDNTKSTTLFNMGTNILNEELKNSGAKELNAYMGVDVTGGITTNTDGGSTSQSGSTKSVEGTYNVGGKPYTKQQLNELGYSDAQIEEAIKLKTIKKQ